jgi:hypothetical protein
MSLTLAQVEALLAANNAKIAALLTENNAKLEKSLLVQIQANHAESDARYGVINSHLQSISEVLTKSGAPAKRAAGKKAEAPAEPETPQQVVAVAAATAADVIAEASKPVNAVPTTVFAWFKQEWKEPANAKWREAHTTPALQTALDGCAAIQKKKADDVAGRLVSAATAAWDFYKKDTALMEKITAEHAALLKK